MRSPPPTGVEVALQAKRCASCGASWQPIGWAVAAYFPPSSQGEDGEGYSTRMLTQNKTVLRQTKMKTYSTYASPRRTAALTMRSCWRNRRTALKRW